MRSADLINKLEDRPFKPFRVHLSDGTEIDVVDPGLVMVGVSSAVMATDITKDEEGHRLVKRWRTIALLHIVQFTDMDDAAGRKKRRRAG